MKPVDFIATIDAAYDCSLDDAAWLERLLRCIGPAMGTGDAPTTGHFYDGATIRDRVSVGHSRRAATDDDDSLGLRANITATSGVLLATTVPRGYRIRHRPLWDRLAAHIGAGARLRTTQPARKMRRLDSDAACALWRTMVQGEWSLVDWFDHDGKRFFLAHDRGATTAAPLPLSARERQVLASAALGHSNKLIAYDLGLATGTVGVILSRAAKKLGVSSRLDLIRLYREK